MVLAATDVPAADAALVRAAASPQCASTAAVCLRHQAAPGRPIVTLMGDSIAGSLDPALLRLAQQHGWTYAAAAHDRCTLIQHWIADSTTGGRLAGWDSCYRMVPRIQAAVESLRPSVIVATDRWLLIDSLDDSGRLLRAGTDAHLQDTELRLSATAAQLTSRGTRLVLIHILPVGQPVQCADAEPPYQYRARCGQSSSADHLTPMYNAMLDRVAGRYPGRVAVIDLADVVCPGQRCVPKLNGIWLRSDGLHFTEAAARWLAPDIDPRLERAAPTLAAG
jgi:lysophospholipase L1-like esterase